MSDAPLLISDNMRFLQQGEWVLKRMDDALYHSKVPPFGQGGIGRHVRHVLDHYASFWDGLKCGRIDFDDRARDLDVEQNRSHALALFDLNRNRMMSWSRMGPDLDRSLEVCHNGAWCQSSVGRELQHLINHTLHHYALVAMVLRLQGVDVADDFGVAPSTVAAQMKSGCESRGSGL
jgi:uncharacterized damage-inducible protein DinB